ncbi:zinc transport system ATP-binding protein [Persephonella hydrogeniphila]|uniref:Zinc transport system ATP-binding protein n=1 Tax=Persephonella hydrogeniphila TaxID=198703 RepID=A0A285NG66_9AQUI|nr:metal ABC transporter ATP-binding protein [Persephonella hydrogeniphila]SNZ07883.1 zinc transport system ATP-binding protein [Persephonella hydrogeniphila]
MNEILKIQDLTVKLNGRVILENINLSIRRKEIVAIVGPNGGGKTTLIKTALGLIKPTAGYVEILGTTPEKAVKTGKIGYLPQKTDIPRNFPFSVLDIVMLGLVNKKLSRREKVELAEKYIQYVGMKGYENHPFSKLSGGQQQRISIARVLVSDPEIIFLDEPSTGVDVVAQESFYDFLQKIREEKGITAVMVSHDIGVVGKFVDKVAGLNRYLHYYGHPKDFFQKHILEKLYGTDVELVVHSPECVACEHFHTEFKGKR